LPGLTRPGAVQSAMISWVDITPTILDVAGVPTAAATFDGRSFRALLAGESVAGWDEVYASHSLHEITMYYPMRVVRTRGYKLIHNLASGLTFPSALDLIQSPTWLSVTRNGGTQFDGRSIEYFLHRPEFELYDLDSDPGEITNLAGDPKHREVKEELTGKLRAFQKTTQDPWLHKWDYE